jgi:glucose/arabinose dehydrogenase
VKIDDNCDRSPRRQIADDGRISAGWNGDSSGGVLSGEPSMTSRLSLSSVAALAFLLVVQPFVIAQGQGPAKGPGGPGPFTFDTGTGQRITVTLVADGLVHPFGMAFPDARTILVTERAGRLRIVRDGKLLPKPA